MKEPAVPLFGPTAKYRGAPTDANGVPLYWDGHLDHIPMRGEANPLLTADEVENAETVFHEHYALYVLPEDKAGYLAVKDQATNGLGAVTKEMVLPDPQNPARLYVHLWWVEFEARRGLPTRESRAPKAMPAWMIPGQHW